MKIEIGPVVHFGVSVRDPQASAQWWQSLFNLETMFEGDDYIGLTNANITIVLSKGHPNPETFEHMSFHLPNVQALHEALDLLKRHNVDLEDPGDEIGPEAPGSKNVGLWFHDPDGYRWELSVQGGR